MSVRLDFRAWLASRAPDASNELLKDIVWKAVGRKDVQRCDFRPVVHGQIHVMECNHARHQCRFTPDGHFICRGSAASEATIHKTAKYVSIASTRHFVPVTIETSGVFYNEAEEFVHQVGHRYTEMTGDPKETSYLFQQVSMAIQR